MFGVHFSLHCTDVSDVGT